jgi:hypothetical protein
MARFAGLGLTQDIPELRGEQARPADLESWLCWTLTNVVAALMRGEPDPFVVSWLDGLPPESIWTTSVTVFEIRLAKAAVWRSLTLGRSDPALIPHRCGQSWNRVRAMLLSQLSKKLPRRRRSEQTA